MQSQISPEPARFPYAGRLPHEWAVPWRRVLFFLLPFALLTVQNLIIFQDHYFGNNGFPWDFPLAYYATVAFWTTAVSKGVWPAWIPFQQMGYPMAMNLQSGAYYPPFWVFPALHIPYTLHAAVVFQCLHVLFGAFGMFCFVRAVLRSPRAAFLGALIFQFFGGFYSNAEHPDIVRAYAIIPWLLFVFYLLDRDSRGARIPRRALLIPLFIYLLATGGYPGNLVAAMLILGVYVVAQLIHMAITGNSYQAIARTAGWILLLTVLGFAISLPHLAPAWIQKGQMARYGEVNDVLRSGYWIYQYPSLFLSNTLVPGEISMTSTFVTLPALVLASFVTLKKLKQHWVFLLVGIVAALMAGGPASFLWFLVSSIFEPVKFSRFPSSDYRGFFAIALILFALLGLQSVVSRQIGWKSAFWRLVFISIWLSQGLYMAKDGLTRADAFKIVAFAGALIALLALFWLRPGRLTNLRVAAVAAFVVFNAYQVLPAIVGWQHPDFDMLYRKNGWRLLKNHQLATYSIFDNLPAQRPERIGRPHAMNYSWEGYITGSYMLGDKAPCILEACKVAEADPAYKAYMLQEWTPILMPVDPAQGRVVEAQVSQVALEAAVAPAYAPDSQVIQTSYGINEVRYRVSLDQPVLMVENEIYYPGWQARLTGAGAGGEEIEAIAANQVFRAWQLPAGKYEMVAYFQFPGLGVYSSVGVLGLAMWASVGFLSTRRLKQKWVMARAAGQKTPDLPQENIDSSI